MTGAHIYCFTPQGQAVASLLESIGYQPQYNQLRSVTYPQELCGLRRGAIFVHVVNHGAQLPPEILEAARRYGLIEVAINDEWMRQRHYSRPAVELPKVGA